MGILLTVIAVLVMIVFVLWLTNDPEWKRRSKSRFNVLILLIGITSLVSCTQEVYEAEVYEAEVVYVDSTKMHCTMEDE